MAWEYEGLTGYPAVKKADADLDPAIADPAQAAAALNALTRAVSVAVRTTDIRAVLQPTLEYAKIGMDAEVRTYTDSMPQQLVQVLWTALKFLDSDKAILAADDAAWAGVVGLMGQLVATGYVSSVSQATILALREVTVPAFGNLVGDDVVAARGMP